MWPLIGRYVKEGLVMAPHHTNDLAPLLRYESSKLDDGALTSLAEYKPRATHLLHALYRCPCARSHLTLADTHRA
jgi:HSP90 family molecular chaperone